MSTNIYTKLEVDALIQQALEDVEGGVTPTTLSDNPALNDNTIAASTVATKVLKDLVDVNTSKVSANGSITTHNDVTDAGSGQIITNQERINIVTAKNSEHNHNNKATLDKFGEDVEGKPTYNGSKVDTTVAQRDVYDALDSNDNTVSLSAKQGKVLDDKKVDKVTGWSLLQDTVKAGYDSAVTWITTNGSNILNHIGITSGNPHGTTKEDLGAAGLNGDSTEVFNVSNAISNNNSVNLGQVKEIFKESITTGGAKNNLANTSSHLIFTNTNAQAIVSGFQFTNFKKLTIINNGSFEIRINSLDVNSDLDKQVQLTTDYVLIGIGGNAKFIYNDTINKWQIIGVFASKYLPEFIEPLAQDRVVAVNSQGISEALETTELLLFRPSAVSDLSKSDLDGFYPPSDTIEGLMVVCENINKIYIKVSATGWKSIPMTDVV